MECGEEERSELAFVAVSQSDMLLGNELGKKFLRQLLGVIRPVAFAPYVGVDRIPISLAKRLQRKTRRLRTALPGRQHHAPMGSGEDPRGYGFNFLLRIR